MNTLQTKHQASNRHMANPITARCSCRARVTLTPTSFVGYADADGMRAGIEAAEFALLNCFSVKHPSPQTLMVALSEMAVAA